MNLPKEFSSCGVGFVASLKQESSHENLILGLNALAELEHRGGTAADKKTSDGAGVMTDIPHELLGINHGDAVAHLWLPRDPALRIQSLRIFEDAFAAYNVPVRDYRDVPINEGVLSEQAAAQRPEFLFAVIPRPSRFNTRYNFEKTLYQAKQSTRGRLRQAGIVNQFFFCSLSAATVVYKALTLSHELSEFFLDLKNPHFVTRFVLFHRRFSTNTATSWDTAQPFRVVAHNGEINTIAGNRVWSSARERALGLEEDELFTTRQISDSGTVNEIMEGLLFLSSIPHPEDILAIMMPQANNPSTFYRFWSRAMEPWDGPALFAFCDGRSIGARLDRNGFRPCRWARTAKHFFLSSEAGSFAVAEEEITAKGSLIGGSSVTIKMEEGRVVLTDASASRENRLAHFDPRTEFLDRLPSPDSPAASSGQPGIFQYNSEDIKRTLEPMVASKKEPIGSMGDTASLTAFSDEARSFFDHFFQTFAQVTNPPLDYLREALVTDLTTILGRRPNIFEPKELVPMKVGIEVESPVLNLGQIDFLKSLSTERGYEGQWPGSVTLDMTFQRSRGPEELAHRITQLQELALAAVKQRVSLIILSDRKASTENPPIPGVLAVTAIARALESAGMRLRASLILDTGEVNQPHHVAVLLGFGAAAVCPYLAIDIARSKASEEMPAKKCEENFLTALESGLLKIMAKMGISVSQSYQNAQLFSIIGLGPDFHHTFFPNHECRIGGISLFQLAEKILKNSQPVDTSELKHKYLFQENLRGNTGEKHSMTLRQAKLLHKAVLDNDGEDTQADAYREYLRSHQESLPVSVRHFLRPAPAETPLSLNQTQPASEIVKLFGSGAMSFGAISAESQRDIFLAMKELGARSNSGEGGENPYYFKDKISAYTKQMASGRFGVTAEYLVSGSEIQIKIAQGAKPGEGGQLMGVKVNAEIAAARHSDENVDLISPPPMHDIYSIEDLKQLIYEFRQLKPSTRVSVKLVSGQNVGTIAVGVAKAGADIIHISGHDGGTGAATLSSMKHAGLPWEFGLIETHRTLTEQGIRKNVTLRVDGGLSTGRDLIIAAILGAEEFDFGKLLLIAEGCIMARICEKNTCPTGIATHDPKFKRLYRGNKDRVIRLLQHLAEDVRHELAKIGETDLRSIVGRGELLSLNEEVEGLRRRKNLDFSEFLSLRLPLQESTSNPFIEPVSKLNVKVTNDVMKVKPSAKGNPTKKSYLIQPKDRAVPALLSGKLAMEISKSRFSSQLDSQFGLREQVPLMPLTFEGSAGQGFAVFNQAGMVIRLYGEANDSVAKSMSGGMVVVRPSKKSKLIASESSIVGNCSLYGATGGKLYIHGRAGNRFAVRNSGAIAVVEGTGMHACEYMTRGTVVILGEAGANIGAGMTGGEIFMRDEFRSHLNREYVVKSSLQSEDLERLTLILKEYIQETDSPVAAKLLDSHLLQSEFVRVYPAPKKIVTTKTIDTPTGPANKSKSSKGESQEKILGP